jgi:hypothetical protein
MGMKKAGLWLVMGTMAVLLGCGIPRWQREAIEDMAAGKRKLYRSERPRNTEISNSESIVAYDTLRPYRLLQDSVAALDLLLDLWFDAAASAEIRLAWEDYQRPATEDTRRYTLERHWSGETPQVALGARRAVDVIPRLTWKFLHPTDSMYLPDSLDRADHPQEGMQTLRVIRRKPYLTVVAVHDELCHAGKYYSYRDYLSFLPNGLLHSVVHFEDACREDRAFSYTRLTWNDSLYIQTIETSWATESEEMREVQSKEERTHW